MTASASLRASANRRGSESFAAVATVAKEPTGSRRSFPCATSKAHCAWNSSRHSATESVDSLRAMCAGEGATDRQVESATTNPQAISAWRNSWASVRICSAPASGYFCSSAVHNSPNVLERGGSSAQICAPTGFTPKYTSSAVDSSTPPSSSSLKMAAGLGCGRG